MVYKNSNRVVLNNMCMLLMAGFIILTRLNFDKAKKQFLIAVISARNYVFYSAHHKESAGTAQIYLGLCRGGYCPAWSCGNSGARARLWCQDLLYGCGHYPAAIRIYQVLYVFFIAGMFYESTEFSQVVKTTVMAALHVLILVVSKDLGGALIFLWSI